LLAGDTDVADGWLGHLVALANCDPSIGVAAPMSIAAPPP
jgi:hypothetical protein